MYVQTNLNCSVPVWPDVGIKSGLIFSKSFPKSIDSNFAYKEYFSK